MLVNTPIWNEFKQCVQFKMISQIVKNAFNYGFEDAKEKNITNELTHTHTVNNSKDKRQHKKHECP